MELINKKPYYAHFIDGMRAVAVLAVIICHLNPRWLPGGFAGVDIFFVISGFVVAISVSGLESVTLKNFLVYFYSRRLLRIYPVLVVCLLATFIGTALFIPYAGTSTFISNSGFFSFFGLSNFILASDGGGYFSPSAEFNPFTHTWSLAIEEQFYVLFPFCFLAWLKGKKYFSLFLFLFLSLCSFAVCIYLNKVDAIKAFYMIWSRFWELGIGVLLFQIASHCGHSFRTLSRDAVRYAIGSDIAFFVMLAGLFLAGTRFAPLPPAFIAIVGAAFVLAFLHGRSQGIAFHILDSKPFRYIGKISYSLYLWHWPVFVIFRWTGGLDTPLNQCIALVLIAGLSVLSYHFIETPPRRAVAFISRPKLIVCCLVMLALGFGGSHLIIAHRKSLSLSTVMQNKTLWYPEEDETCPVAMDKIPLNQGFCTLLAPKDRSKIQQKKLFVLGDSHSGHYFTLLQHFTFQTGIPVYLFNNAGCPFLSLVPNGPDTEPSCKKIGDAAYAYILDTIHPGDVVFLPSLRLPRLVDQWNFLEPEAVDISSIDIAAPAQQKLIADAIQVLRGLTEKGAVIILEAPTPMLLDVPFRCSDWFNKNNPICRRGSSIKKAYLDKLREPILASYREIRAALPTVSIWDPAQELCRDGECSAYRDGKPLFFDGDHLSGYANTLLLPSFSDFLENKIPKRISGN